MKPSTLILTTLASLTLLTFGACGSASDAKSFEMSEAAKADFATLPNLTGEHVWNVDMSKSSLTFSGKHNGDVFTGKISQFKAAVKLNPTDPKGAEIHAVMSLAGIDIGDDDRNANLPTEDWFHISAFPTARFSSTNIKKVQNETYAAQGMLTLKGVSKPITLLFDLSFQDNDVIATGEANLMRTDFNLGQGSDFKDESWVSFPVVVNMTLYASPTTP